jgi:hypothetical protein
MVPVVKRAGTVGLIISDCQKVGGDRASAHQSDDLYSLAFLSVIRLSREVDGAA